MILLVFLAENLVQRTFVDLVEVNKLVKFGCNYVRVEFVCRVLSHVLKGELFDHVLEAANRTHPSETCQSGPSASSRAARLENVLAPEKRVLFEKVS